MSLENVRAFVAKVKSDGDFCKQINEATTKQARLEIAQGADLEFTEEEYNSVKSELPVWTMEDWLAARRAYDQFETSWLSREFNPWRGDLADS